jgi:predicted ABC-type ATPase
MPTPNTLPSAIVIGGPNGAGNTTSSRSVIAEYLGVGEFVNAHVIAAGFVRLRSRACRTSSRKSDARLKELAAAFQLRV